MSPFFSFGRRRMTADPIKGRKVISVKDMDKAPLEF
jgi:hypothetical protein